MDTRVHIALKRYLLRKASTQAVAEALKRGAMDEPFGATRHKLLRQASRLAACSITQHARITSKPDEGIRLRTSNKRACRHRMCPQESAVNARAQAEHLEAVFDEAWRISPGARALFLTLTTKNVPIDQVGKSFRDHDAAVKRFFALKRIQDGILGHYTAFEVAIRGTKEAPKAGVHSHSILLVEPGALSDHRYIRQAEYVRLWQAAARISYKPVVDIRAVKSKSGSTDREAVHDAIRELVKYVVKSAGFFQHQPGGRIEVSPRVAVALAIGLHRRRVARYDRIFQQAMKALKRKA